MRQRTILGTLAATALVGALVVSAASARLPEALKTPTGNFITLLAFAGPTSSRHVASAEVKICTSAHTPKDTEAYPPFFTLSLSGGLVEHILFSGIPSPVLRPTPLDPNQCASGWIDSAVPAGAQPAALVYTYGPAVRWTLG